jgi:protein involved in sex pheromone biosynthesis
MKKSLKIALVGALLFTGSSCATHSAHTSNLKSQNTQVILSQDNFIVRERIQGKASATYVFGLGGLSKKSLLESARANMYENANLEGGSKALINETFSVKNSFFFFFWKNQVNVSADIVEFTK